MMGSAFCDDCNLERSIVYCDVHSANFCFQCDQKLHSMPFDDQDHSRFLLCNNCVSQIAFIQYPDQGLCLCQKCLSNFYSRFLLCNSSNNIYGHTDLDFDSLSSTSHSWDSSQSSRIFQNFDNYTENQSLDYIDILKDSEDLIITELFDEITKYKTPNEILPSSPLDMSSVTHYKDYNTETLAHTSSQYYNNNQMIVSKEETNNLDYGPSQLILSKEILPWEDNKTQTSSRFISQERQDVLKRYYAKRKKRKFGKQIRYESRKSTADTKRRMKGRFTKANAEYDYDPKANKINKETNKTMT